MNSQEYLPPNWMGLLLLATLIRVGYEYNRPAKPILSYNIQLQPAVGAESGIVNDKSVEILPWQKKASEKAVKHYAETQEKKWQRWNDAMFER